MQKIVVIGGVAAGLKAAAKVKRENPAAQVVVLERGRLISYGACGMPFYVAGEIPAIDNLMMTDKGELRNQAFFHQGRGIDVRTQSLATAINRAAKIVQVKDLVTGREYGIPYDQMVIATGAIPLKPDWPGSGLANIHQLWHPDDALAVRKGIEQGMFKRAVIIGAGLIGMEMAEALHRQKLEVTVVEMKEQVFPALLDSECAEAVSQYARYNGINVLTGEKVERFTGDGVVQTVVTDRRTLPADLVILAVGVRPNAELAREAGLVTGGTGAIAVNEYLQTSDPAIYAGGDCVENTHLVSGQKVFAPMGSTANKHGRVIGDNLCGLKVKFRGVLNTAVVRLMDLNIGKVGLTEGEAKQLGYDYVTATVSGRDKPHYMPESGRLTSKLIVHAQTRQVLGAQILGDGRVDKRIDVIAAVLNFAGTVDDVFDIDLAYAPPYSSPIDHVAVAANAIMNKLK